jgi:hypothetical protein
MLTGHPPCTGTDAIDVLHRKAHEDPTPIGDLRPELPAQVQRLVTRALSRAPRDRQPSMSALKDDVLACLGVVDRAATGPAPIRSQPLGATLLAPATARVRERRRRVTRAVVGVAAGMAGLAIAGYLFVGRRPAAVETAAVVVESVPAAPPPAAPPAAPAAPAPAPAVVADTESSPWPEREAAATKRSEARAAAPLPSLSALRRAQLGAAGGSPVDVRTAAPGPASSRAVATRHNAVAALAEADPARKATAAPAEPPPGAPGAGTDGILQRGQTAFDRGDYPEAVRRGREAIAAGGARGGHLLVGDAYYRLDRFPDALREYQAALALDPGNASIKRRRDLAEKGAAP